MRVPTFVATAILVLILPGTAAAQRIPSPYRFFDTSQEAGPFAGIISPGTGRFGYGPGPGLVFGGRYGLELTGPLSVEGVVSWIHTTRDVVDPRRQEGRRVIGEADARLLDLDVRLKLGLTGRRTWHALNPFVLAGVGLAWDLAGASPDEQDLELTDRFDFGTAFVSDLGGGVRWFLNDRWIVRADALLHLWKLDAPEGFRDAERGFVDVGDSEWVNAKSISIGLGYRF